MTCTWKSLLWDGFLVVAVIAYVLLGGMMFHFIEGQKETENIQLGNSQFKHFIGNNTCVNPEDLRDFIGLVIKLRAAGVVLSNSSNSEPSTWSFSRSVYFVMTVITSIGYGNVTPTMPLTQTLCVVLALFGLPLNLILLSKLGEFFCSRVEQLVSRLTGGRAGAKRSAQLRFLILSIGGSVLFIFIPSIFFTYADSWTYQTSLYYSFITLSTIGFGDYVAGSALKGSLGAMRIFHTIWIELGLAWFAAMISTIQDVMAKKLEEREQSMAKQDKKGDTDIPMGNGTNECIKTRL